VWPNFFIVGVAKAGTTSLVVWLRQHPQVFIPHIKEPRYFASDLVEPFVRTVIKDKDEYLRLFRGAERYPARGEASTSYFRHWGKVPERIKAAVPEARIIIILRDPIERAYSAWLMHVRHGREHLPFAEAVRNSALRHLYCQTYTVSIKKYLEVFGHSKMLILFFEDLTNNPRDLLQRVAKFLEIDETPVMNIKLSVENPGGMPRNEIARGLFLMRKKVPWTVFPLPKSWKRQIRRAVLSGSKPPIDQSTIDYLRQIFEPDLEELRSILGDEVKKLRKGW